MATPNASESKMARLSFQGDRFDRRVGLPQLKTGIDQERIASINSSPGSQFKSWRTTPAKK
jgi:hypothetical protein